MNRKEKNNQSIKEQAVGLVESGLSIIPVKTDGSKAPAIKSWKKFQEERAPLEVIEQWFNTDRGIAIIGGKVSGNLEMLDFDEPKKFPEWKKLIQAYDKQLFNSLVVVETPSGGFHVYYRSPEFVEGNQKLAQGEADGKRKTLIETRGEGGYVLAPGSPAKCHELRKPYVLRQGKLTQIPTLKSGKRELLLLLAHSLNEFIKPDCVVDGSVAGARGRNDRPGDQFNEKASWDEILKPHGWSPVGKDGQVQYWKRPNKKKGVSATTNYAGSDLLYVFSSNADPLESDRAYSKFGAHTMLNHNGNFKAAAAELAAQGYGASRDQVQNYEMTENGLIQWKSVKDGRVPVRLTNFNAQILADVVEDDGEEERYLFEVETRLNGRQKIFTITSSEFPGMTWVMKNLGAQAVIYAGFSAKDHTRAAIQVLSGEIQRKSVYTHIGWRKLDGQWVYLHGGGAIGANGAVPHVNVGLQDSLAAFVLPEPPIGNQLCKAVRASLGILEMAPPEIMHPLLASIFRSVLGENHHSIHLSGQTGTGKSELAALIQQHFGAKLDAKNLPANWCSTDNALEAQAFVAKDAVLVIDDFAPSGSVYDVLRWHKKAERIFRAQGNKAGKTRMRQDSSIRGSKWPRGLILSTGEDIPKMQSVRARMLILELSQDDLIWEKLSNYQSQAADGLFAQALAGYLKFAAEKHEDEARKRKSSLQALREKATKSGMHKRTPDIVASLYYGIERFLCFAEEVNAITSDERRTYLKQAWGALGRAAAAQASFQQASEPTQRFLELLRAAISSGRAHVTSVGGSEPENPERWGWKQGQTIFDPGEGEAGYYNWHSRGDRIGWVDGRDLYLEPQAAFGLAQRVGREAGDEIQVTRTTLHKRLKDKGLLKSDDKPRNRLVVRRTLEKTRREVLHLDTQVVMPEETSQEAQMAQGPENRDSQGTVSGTEIIQ